jgi:cell division protein FtsB
MKRPVSPLMRGIWILLGVIAIVSLTRSVVDLWTRRDLVLERKMKFEKVEKQNSVLKKQLEEQSTPEFLEKQAREKLNLARPDDIVVLLNEASSTGVSKRRFENFFKQASWRVWWELFF